MSRLYCAFLAFFEDAKSNKILSLPNTTSLEDNNAMFEELHNVNDGFAKVVKWEFEVEDEFTVLVLAYSKMKMTLSTLDIWPVGWKTEK
jgi:hypothetical protein